MVGPVRHDASTAIRPFEDGDEAIVIAVWHRSGRVAYQFLPTWQALTLERAGAVFREVIRPRCDIWVGTCHEQVVAFLAMAGSYVDRMYVDPTQWRKGWGTRLVLLAKTLRPHGLEPIPRVAYPPGPGTPRPPMLPSRFPFIIGLALTLTACASMHGFTCKSGEQSAIHDSLYFGTAKPTGVVTPEEWAEFLRGTVTPRFPQGLTVWPASGQWRSAEGPIVREASNVLYLVHPNDEPSETAVLEIVAKYKSQFQQDAVLRVKAHACASF